MKIKPNVICNTFIINSICSNSLWAFLILNLPSVKVIYFSELINILALFGLYFFSIIGNVKKLYLSKAKSKFLVVFSIFWVVLLFSGVIGQDSVMTYKLIIRYIYVYFTVIGLLFWVKEKHIPGILFLQIFWGTGLSIFQIIYGFTVSMYDNAIHYNTLAVPVACSLISISGLLFFTKKIVSGYLKIIMWICMTLNLLALTSSPGRSPVIFSILIIILFSFLKAIFKNKKSTLLNKHKKNSLLKTAFILIIIIYVGYQNIQTKLSSLWLERYYNLFSKTEDEPRNQLWLPALNAIANNPLGYGLNSSETIIGFYPHNIFLEILFSAGIFGLIPFLLILFILFYQIRMIVAYSSYYLPVAMISIYLLLMWNVSFDLASSYMPFGAMAIAIGLDTTRNKTN